MRHVIAASLLCALAFTAQPTHAQRATERRPLEAADIDAIATLLKLEDTRQFDEVALTSLVNSKHPEVRRRAITSVGRIVNDKGRALLNTLHEEKDPELLATVVFATGQLRDQAAVPWLGSLLKNSATPIAVAKEAAQALGKMPGTDIPAAAAREELAQFLLTTPVAPETAPVVGEALLSIGRFTTMDDPAPMVRWTTARDVEVRWRAAWALFRPRNPAAVPHLMTLSADSAPEVRFWALRGLAPAQVDKSTVKRADASARLRQAVNDPDRRVRTEAIRALVLYDDDASVAAVLAALTSNDTWLSVSAAEALGRMADRKDAIVPALVAASAAGKPTSMRISALLSLQALSPEAAHTLATALAKDPSVTAQQQAATTLRQLEAAAARAAGNAPANAGRAGGQGRAGGPARPALQARPDAEYRALVTQWIVPDYNGEKRPHVVFTTPRGAVDVELHPGDAPFGVEYLMKVIESGEIANTEFGRVVPNFVAQQRGIRNEGSLRDEVNRQGLLRGTLSWASAGLDTGRPGYTLGSTPQPHNEGNFTSLGHVVKGIEVVDRLELGDKIISADIKK